MVSHCCVGTPNIVPSTVTTLRFVNLYFIPAGLQCSNGMPWPLVSWTLDDLGTIRARRCDTHLVLLTSRKHHGVCMNFLWNNGIRVWYINIWGILMVNVTIYSSTMDPMGHGIMGFMSCVRLLRDDSNIFQWSCSSLTQGPLVLLWLMRWSLPRLKYLEITGAQQR